MFSDLLKTPPAATATSSATASATLNTGTSFIDVKGLAIHIFAVQLTHR
jgi:hypothetical protein